MSNKINIIIIRTKFIESGRFLFIRWLNPHSIEFIDWLVLFDLLILLIIHVVINNIINEIDKGLIMLMINFNYFLIGS